ncbi:MAG: hypothetical protein DRN06_05200 [Thermoprotei archaeon]|nr:MAG: hypothetical protein DRN06_05200 [Thermoprotei archaeon]
MPFRLFKKHGDNLNRPFDEVRFVSIDLETSGLDPKRNGILAIGAVVVKEGEIKLSEVFHVLVKPEGIFDEKSSFVHGITPADVEDKPSFKEVAPSLLSFIDGGVLVGYNIGFDLSFLNEFLKRHGMPTLRGGALDLLPLTYGVMIKLGMDPVVLKMDYQALMGKMGLDTLADILSMPILRRHSSIGDAFTAAFILLKLLFLAKLAGCKSLGDLFELVREGERHAKRIDVLSAIACGF